MSLDQNNYNHKINNHNILKVMKRATKAYVFP